MPNQYPYRPAAILSALLLLLCQSIRAQTPGFDVFVTPTNNEAVNAGSNFDIIWTPSVPVGTVTIRLMQGNSEFTQEFGPTIASGIDSTTGKYTWSIPSSYGDYPSYGFKLQLDSDPSTFQYSFPFQIIKAAGASATPPQQSTAQGSAVGGGGAAPPTTVTVAVTKNAPSNTPAPVAPTTVTVAVTQIAASTPANVIYSGPKTETTDSQPSGHANSPSSTSNPLVATTYTSTSKTNIPDSTTFTTASSAYVNAATTSTSTIPPSTSSSSAPITAADTASPTPLSTPAKAGIAIGAVLGTAILFLLAYIAFLLRRRSRRNQPPPSVDPTGRDMEVANSGSGWGWGIWGWNKPELYSERDVAAEMDGVGRGGIREGEDGRGTAGELLADVDFGARAGKPVAGSGTGGMRGMGVKGRNLPVIHELG